MPRKAYFVFVCFFLAQITIAHADSLQNSLNEKYKNHVMALRSPFTHGDQKFDSSGKSLNPPPAGPWLTYGGIYVKSLKLSSNVLRLEGKRVGFGADKKGEQTQIALGDTMKVEIHLDQPLKSMDEAGAVLGRVFVEGASVEQASPRYGVQTTALPVKPFMKLRTVFYLPEQPTLLSPSSQTPRAEHSFRVR